jgi:hypothetical protein
MARPIDDMSYMIWPFIYEALLPRLLTLTLCRQVNMMIIILHDQDAYLGFDARGDRRNSRGKKQPLIQNDQDENMHHQDDDLTS